MKPDKRGRCHANLLLPCELWLRFGEKYGERGRSHRIKQLMRKDLEDYEIEKVER